MNKKELIQKIKNEIKEISQILKENKKNFKQNQRVYQKSPLVDSRCYGKIKSIISSDYKKIQCYPFSKPWNGAIEVDGKCYFNGNFWDINPDVSTAKCHLTLLHIIYNSLRNKKLHCHNAERNEYYVKYYKAFIERNIVYEEEKQNADLSSSSPS